MSTRALRTLSLLAAFAPTSACYSYTPTEIATVSPGDRVRFVVTREGAGEVAEIMDSHELRLSVTGELVGRESQSLMLRVLVARDPQRIGPSLEQIVRIPEGEVLTADLRRFSTGKTALVAAGGATLGAFLLHSVFDVFSDPRRPPDDTELSILPLLFRVLGR